MKYELNSSLEHSITEIRDKFREVMYELSIQYWQGQEGFLPNLQRMLIFLQWSRMFRVPVEQLIKSLVVEFRRRFQVSSSRRLRISLTALTGDVAFEFSKKQFGNRTFSRPAPIVAYPKLYSSVDQYNQHMEQLRRKSRSRKITKAYRGSENWQAPVTDPFVKLLGGM